MKGFESALKSGNVVVTRIWENTKSAKKQWSIMFQQTIERPNTDPGLLLQGISNTRVLTTVRSASAEVLQKAGFEPKDYKEADEALYAVDLYKKVSPSPFNLPVNIELTETHDPYIRNVDGSIAKDGQGTPYTIEPKVNPNGGEVIKVNGKDVFPHTSLVFRAAKHTFLTNSSTTVSSNAVAEEVEV